MENPSAECETLVRGARAAYAVGDFTLALHELEQAWPSLEALPEPQRSLGLTAAYGLRASVYRSRGPLEQALADYEAMLACAPDAGQRLEARAGIAEILALRGQYDDAVTQLRDVEQQAVTLGCQPAVAAVNYGLGTIAQRRGETDQALKFLTRAWSQYRTMGDVEQQMRTLVMLGSAHVRRGEYDSAIRYHEEALRLARQAGHRQREAIQLNNLGECHQRLGDMAVAYDYHQRSLAMREQYGLVLTSDLIRNIGVDLVGLERPEEALALLRRALAMAEAERRKDYIMQAQASLADGLLACGQQDEVVSVAQALLDESAALQAPYFRARALLVLGRVQLARGDRVRAYGLLEEGHCAAQAVHSADLLWQLHAEMAQASAAPALAEVHDRIAAETVLESAALLKDQDLKRRFLDSPRVRQVLARAQAKGIQLISRRSGRI